CIARNETPTSLATRETIRSLGLVMRRRRKRSMNARNMLKALVVVLAATTAVGCTQRTIIEEPTSQGDEANDPHLTAVATDNGDPIADHPLYVRSGDTKLGEEQSGPFPEPWQQRLGPFPEPWHRQGDQSDDGKSPPPPSDPNPNPDPNP